jgi:hypothetical protein
LFRGGADYFLHDQRAGDATPPGGPGRRFDGDVVVGNDRGDFGAGQVDGHLKVHYVTLVVLDDEDAAAAGVDRADCRDHLVGRW